MSDLKLNCPHCHRPLNAREELRGRVMPCPSCHGQIQVPCASGAPAADSRPPIKSSSPTGEPVAALIFCPNCGQQNAENNFKCVRCGSILHGQSPPEYSATDDGTLGGLIPYRNAWALSSYYLGVFALMPCFGIPLGIGAVVLGILGLRLAKSHAEARGKGHAWTGIILGGLSLAGHFLAAILIALSV